MNGDQALVEAVRELAEASTALTDMDLNQPWAWRFHNEGTRFALIGTYHELLELSMHLGRARAADSPRTLMQRSLGLYNTAYRELEALLLGVSEDDYDAEPAPGEWPLRLVIAHIVGAQRRFFSLIHYALRRHRDDPSLPMEAPSDEHDRVAGSYEEFRRVYREGTLAEMLAYYNALHERTLDEFASITDEEATLTTLWWEAEELDLVFRMQRFEAHLRQHSIQVEKVLAAIAQRSGQRTERPTGPDSSHPSGFPWNESRAWLRLVYRALADVEAATIGAPDFGREDRLALAETIRDRSRDMSDSVVRAREFVAAVAAGDKAKASRLVEEHPELVDARAASGVSSVLTAIYNRQRQVAEWLVESGAELDVFEAAALGRVEDLKGFLADWSDALEAVAVDGFTPLHLAAFFGEADTVRWLIANGAPIEREARNPSRVRPLHSAAAGGSAQIVEMLLEAGAAVNARQQRGFTPLHAAAQAGDLEMTAALLRHGADRAAEDDDGRTAAEFAHEAGHVEVERLLQS